MACLGLQPTKHLGKTLNEMKPHLKAIEAQYGCNVCGEGGEYESLTLDCPLFKHKKIVIDQSELQVHSDCQFSPVAYLNLKKFHLIDK